ncbi:DUF6907 domain-containing protein [Nonomuraea typhae]|uniref:DUF6907 domain-containing protein n=1 Tax=Nonomuraea typhae TaxID=2603600 RepID=UPI0012FC30F6|nr:hypothetical protein [Nonomuraea typhae]
MNDRTTLNDEAARTTGRADAETAQPRAKYDRTRYADGYGPQVPEAWEDKAYREGFAAANKVRFQYVGMAKARENERDDEAAYWLESHPCPEWCSRALHLGSDHPTDRMHDSAIGFVSLNTMEPEVYPDPDRFGAPQVNFQLTQHYREVEPRIYVSNSAQDLNLYASLDEAEQFANALLTLVARGRGEGSPT